MYSCSGNVELTNLEARTESPASRDFFLGALVVLSSTLFLDFGQPWPALP
jgi:hypothetical protein